MSGHEGAYFDEGALVGVQTAQPLDRLLDYRAPEGGCAPGAFVEVPLGPRKVLGVVWGPGRGDWDIAKVRSVIRVLDAAPMREELRSIADIGHYDPAINTVYFPNSVSSSYWSSNTYSFNTNNAWYVYFYYGSDNSYNKSSIRHSRAVRGGHSRSLDHLVINGDGTVTDKSTGLMWQGATDDPLPWVNSIALYDGMTIDEHTGWRLPTLKELASIVDLEKNDPSIDDTAFQNTFSSRYWSASTEVIHPDDCAWSVDFTDGQDYSLSSYKPDSCYTRAVRGGQPCIDGNLYITTPTQASCWDIGSVMPITWDPGDVPETEEVKITLSRTGGGGTLQQIAITENDGYHEWKVSGLASWNGWLEIEPTSPTWSSKATGTGSQPVVTITRPPNRMATVSGALWVRRGSRGG